MPDVGRSRLLALSLVLLAGCQTSGDDPPVPEVTPPPAATTSTVEQTTTTSATSFEVPAVIDLAYVQRVLTELYRLEGEAVRHAYATKAPDAELEQRLTALLGGDALEEARAVLSEHAGEGFVRFADPPGDPVVRAVAIIQATPTCMVIRADLDFRPFFKARVDRRPQATLELRRFEVLPHNATGWGVLVAGIPAPGLNLEVCP